MSLPSLDELNLHDSPDEVVAAEHFLGLDLEAAAALFAQDSLTYQWDLMWMGPVAFAYYLPAATHYLSSDQAVGEVDMIDALYQIISLRWQREEIALARAELLALISYVVETYPKFEVEESIYGNLREKYIALGSLISGKQDQHSSPPAS